MPRRAETGRVIRRYENRKLYDTQARRYVTVEDLGRMVAAGEEVRVVDQASGDDISTVVLAQVILEGLKQRTAQVPRGVLERLIRWSALPAAKHWGGPQEAAARARDEVQRIVAGLLGRGRLTLEEALALRQEVAESVHRIVADAQRGLESALQGLVAGSDKGATHPALALLKERLMTLESEIGPPQGKKGKAKSSRKPFKKSRKET
ncbi:MAG TPA: polyhydroxyalkanoate synthesis regulator DNA-binding domain-containing protein [Vicinamibacteria bacterium]|nr:polyhydroxyalkanoate synthesis regulator DNA-binding domain-containing protein [Vicinamibacteria bacterium]